MLDIVKLSETLQTRLQHETDLLMSDRLMTRDIIDARSKELLGKRDEEIRRIDQWASQQKSLVAEVFGAMLAELEADRARNESNIERMLGDRTGPQHSAKVERLLKAAE